MTGQVVQHMGPPACCCSGGASSTISISATSIRWISRPERELVARERLDLDADGNLMCRFTTSAR